MIEAEDTPRGSVLLFEEGKRDEHYRMTNEDLRAVASLFAVLDRWDREEAEKKNANDAFVNGAKAVSK